MDEQPTPTRRTDEPTGVGSEPNATSNPRSEIRCWSCKAPLEVTTANRGKMVKCPGCGTKQRLPLPPVAAETTAPPVVEARATPHDASAVSRYAWLFGLLLAVPLIGFGVAEAIRTHFSSELRSVLQKQYPSATQEQLAQITVDRVCEDATVALQDFCRNNSNLNLLSRAAVGAGAVGLALLLFIRLAGTVAKSSRVLLLVLFRPGLYLTAVVLIGLILIHAAVAMGAIYYGESALVGRIHVGIIAAIGLGALAGVAAMARSTFSLVRKAETFVVGKAVSREDEPQLWNEVEGTAQKLAALRPEHIVVGLDPNFFVTEADVICLTGRLGGRTLYCSLPLCRILSRREFTSVVGHELGHFKGQDTRFSERFYPIYRGTVSSLDALQAAGGDGSGSVALLPAIAVLSYFLESFSMAEKRLSRHRELAADETASSITGPHVIATALVKLHAFSGIWTGLQEAAVSALRERKVFVNASKAYADAVRQSAVPDALSGIADIHLTHPTDSHPPLSARLESLRVRLNDVASEALSVTPAEAAITLLSGAEKLEEEVSEAYQVLLARRLGINLDEDTQPAEGA